MQLPNDRIYYLWEVVTSKKATPQELQELREWINSDNDSVLKQEFEKLWQEIESGRHYEHVSWIDLASRIRDTDLDKVTPNVTPPPQKPKRWILVAAATVIIIGLAVAYFLFTGKGSDRTPQKTAQQENAIDISAPIQNRAFIRSSKGQTIALNSMQEGVLAIEGNIRVVKHSNGQVIYEKLPGEPADSTQLNTLYNPKGSKVIDIVLTDGSRIWLNAASSITYPVAFTGKERKVTIKGEAYFEVSYNEQKPFKVLKEGVEVTVLGTHFNVNAYDDEPTVKVSLLQGAVSINTGSQKSLLHSGQQAQIKTSISIQDNVDMDDVVAWKNGLFSFKNTNLTEVMQQIARWYGIEVKYEGKLPLQQFGGKIPRSSSLNKVLEILAENGVHYRFCNGQIVILP